MEPEIMRYGSKKAMRYFWGVKLYCIILLKPMLWGLGKTMYKLMLNKNKTTSLGSTTLMRAITFMVEIMY